LEYSSALFWSLAGFPLSLEASMPKSSVVSSFYPESSWTLSCCSSGFSFTVILRKTSDNAHMGDHQQLPCSDSRTTHCSCRVCSPSWC
jgi:hypothetical protein